MGVTDMRYQRENKIDIHLVTKKQFQIRNIALDNALSFDIKN